MIAPWLITSIRLAVLVGWSIIAIWSLPAFRRVTTAAEQDSDWIDVALAIVGVSLVGFQVNVLSGAVPPRTDYWSMAFLLLLALAAGVVILLVRLPNTPEGHKRAVVGTHIAILAACLVGGFLG